MQWNTELLVGGEQFGIHLVEALRAVLEVFRRRVVGDGLVIDLRVVHVGPLRGLHATPLAIGREAPFEQPLRLVLLCRNETDDVLVETRRERVRLDLGDESRRVLAGDASVDDFL